MVAVHTRGARAELSQELHTEEFLHFVPGREDRERSQEREHEQHHPEADVRVLRRAPPFDARAAPRALATVVALDGTRVERRRLVRKWGRICHITGV